MIDPNDGSVRFENEGTLEPLPVVGEAAVVLRAEGLTKIYPAVTAGRGRRGAGAVSGAGSADSCGGDGRDCGGERGG